MQRFLVSFLAAVLLCACSVQSGPPSGATPPASVLPQIATGLQGRTAACPGGNFPSFLATFASDPLVRQQYTATTVLVTDWKDLDDTRQGTTIVPVLREDYRDFTLRYSNGVFRHASSDGTVDATPIDIAIVETADGFLVAYEYGMSEGNSWLFTATRDCWQLTADPEPPIE